MPKATLARIHEFPPEQEQGPEVLPFKHVEESAYQLERRALEAIVQFDRYDEAIDAGVTSSTFEDQTFAILWREIERLNKDGTPDFFEAKLNLLSAGILPKEKIDALEIEELPPPESTGTHVPLRISRLIENASQRKIREIVERAALHAKDGQIEQSLSILAQIEKIASQTRSSLSAELNARKFDPAVEPEQKEPLLLLKGVPIIRRGNISTLVAPDKAGKSHVLAAMIRAVATGKGELSFESQEVGKVVYIDCEQDEGDFWALMRYQAQANPDEVAAYRLTGMSAGKARRAMRELFKKHEGAVLFAIDGYADLIGDVNDSEEANDFVAEIMALSDQYNCAVTGVLHLNPGSEEKSRGHLGSQLGRKSETVLKIKIDRDERHLYTQRARKKPITEANALRFGWDEERAGFKEINGTPGDARREAKMMEFTRLILDVEAKTGMKAWRHGALRDAIMEAEKVKDRTARTRINDCCELGILRFNNGNGIYTSMVNNGNS